MLSTLYLQREKEDNRFQMNRSASPDRRICDVIEH